MAKGALEDILINAIQLPFILIVVIAELAFKLIFLLLVFIWYMAQGEDAFAKTGDFMTNFGVTKALLKLFGQDKD